MIFSEMVSKNKMPTRGDVFYADLTGIEKSIGSEQKGRRPVLIIQNDVGNQYSGTTIIAVMTTKIKRHMPTHVIFDNCKVLPYRTVVCTEQIKTIDKTRLEEYKGNVGEKMMKKVDAAIAISMGIKKNSQITLVEKVDQMFEEENEIMNLVKRETELDNIKHNWIGFAENQLRFFSNVKQYIVNLKLEKEELEKEIEDILSFIESTNYNAPQGYKIYKMLRDRRVLCRDKLREISCLEVLIEEMNCEEMQIKYQNSLIKIRNQEQRICASKVVEELIQMVG